MKLVAGLLLTASLVGACQTAVAPTPQIVYVTPAPAQSPLVLEQTGSGTIRLAPFDSPGSYRVDLDADCLPGLAVLTLIAYGPDGNPVETLLMDTPKGGASSRTTYGMQAGRTILEVGAINCTWEVKVTI